MSAGTIARGLRRIRLARLSVAVAALTMMLAVLGPWGIGSSSAESFDPVLHEGSISDPLDVDWYPFFALAGERYVVALERVGLAAGRIEIWKPAVDGDEPMRVSESLGTYPRLTWMAPASGAWRVRVSGSDLATGSYRLWIRSDNDAVGSELSTARLSAFDDEGVLTERSWLEVSGDVDWYAFPVAAGNRYAVWSVLGSVDGLSGAVLLPDADSFQELHHQQNAISGVMVPTSGGLAVLEVRGAQPWSVGSYAVGVTRWGEAPEPVVSLPPRPTSSLQIDAIEASSEGSEAHFAFRGEWGPIRETSGLRVWIDTDPGTDDEDEWEYLLRSNDGRRARLWSFEREAWVASGRVGARGFDALVMRWSGRTANEQIRWQASVKNADESWTLSRPRLLDLPHPRPSTPELWHARDRTGAEDPRWQAELDEAGVVRDLPDDALVVVLDAGHGVDTGPWMHGVMEAESNLAFALRIEELLEAEGVTVVLTRRSAGRPYLNLDEALWRADYQVRAELAHLAMADVFVSIHSNANFNEPNSGLEAWYLPRWNGDGLNFTLSETLLTYVSRALAEFGYPTSTLTYDTSCWELVNGVCDPIYVLAPFLLVDADVARRWGLDPGSLGLSDDPWGAAINQWLWSSDLTEDEPPINLIDPKTQTGPGRIVRGNLMPTTLLELLYITNEADAAILRNPHAREVIARAIADGILEFLGVDARLN
ncbi:MAG: N-acetylmuramoyl-L-alanine amidase [Chloroflexota bacterium]|nr:N-acetylmuramoyl-L-alanine amidase [Chloroflexota bacterium]MDE2895493.1 N-acetylmuramoyl-L-alanine amidase [Chloroflexota bacterium]